jgi:DNA-binding MarR family transcriptional regulator
VPMPTDIELQTYAAATNALARLARVLERACNELSLPHYRVLSAIAEGEERASRVAARLSLGKPAVSAAVDALVTRGLVERGGDAADQRVTSLQVTPTGREVLGRCQVAMNAALSQVLAHSAYPSTALETVAGLGQALDAHADERLAQKLAGDTK